ncbi:DUF2971 domain-containing protein [Thalassorhabdus alkalitolerans]|uniref:DUF2971 domain-containing protein n=1 Tax=Thalassorhabdus alkalitolerans TaxID=2282697 RepID=A0ABW0YNH7_9BACI
MDKKGTLAEALSLHFWQSVDQQIRKDHTVQKELYHYTGLDSLMGMVETNNLWMSRGTFLNDSNELIYIEGIINKVLGQVENKLTDNFGEDTYIQELKKLFILELKQTWQRFMEKIDLDDFEVYIFSLTENKDSLALWYNYAKGDGYNIGFSSGDMLKKINDFSSHFAREYTLVYGRVIYDRREQEQIVMDFLMETFQYLSHLHPQYTLQEIGGELSEHFFSILATCSIFFKDEAFKSEEEYRIALPRKLTTKERGPEVFFRASNGVIIPFITIHFPEKLPIKRVTIGPKNNIDIAKAGMEYYLKSKGYETERMVISKSVASLRY